MGQTLRAFQPTIKELQQVSQEFKSALETEVRSMHHDPARIRFFLVSFLTRPYHRLVWTSPRLLRRGRRGVTWTRL